MIYYSSYYDDSSIGYFVIFFYLFIVKNYIYASFMWILLVQVWRFYKSYFLEHFVVHSIAEITLNLCFVSY